MCIACTVCPSYHRHPEMARPPNALPLLELGSPGGLGSREVYYPALPTRWPVPALPEGLPFPVTPEAAAAEEVWGRPASIAISREEAAHLARLLSTAGLFE